MMVDAFMSSSDNMTHNVEGLQLTMSCWIWRKRNGMICLPYLPLGMWIIGYIEAICWCGVIIQYVLLNYVNVKFAPYASLPLIMLLLLLLFYLWFYPWMNLLHLFYSVRCMVVLLLIWIRQLSSRQLA